MPPLRCAPQDGEWLQGIALEVQQLRFLLWRHRIAKLRGWGVTLVEILSPVLIM